MYETLGKIEDYIRRHHLLSLATKGKDVWCCSLFYTYDTLSTAFIVASDPDTEHMKNVNLRSYVAGTIATETKSVGKIQGIQFFGEMVRTESPEHRELYFREFPYARVMNPTLWVIRIDRCKLTDNTLGFGKKLIWERKLSE